jgi:suppressor of fused-like protein
MIEKPGLEAILNKLRQTFGPKEPTYFTPSDDPAAIINEPLDGIVAYLGSDSWVFVTLGFSELYAKESPNPAESGFGFELVFRLKRAANEEEVPLCVIPLLQRLASYVFNSGKVFEPGDSVNLKGPLFEDSAGNRTAFFLSRDEELGQIDTKNGQVAFLLVTGILAEEWDYYQQNGSTALEARLRETDALTVTDVHRIQVRPQNNDN